MIFGLLLKNSGDVIDKTHASNLEEAINFFRNRKQMDEKTFNNLYEVKEDARKER